MYKAGVSFSKGSGQEGNIYAGQNHTQSNNECVLKDSLLSSLSLSRTCTEIALKEIHSSLT